MKVTRFLSIVICTVAFILAGGFAYQVLFTGGASRSGGLGYGNLQLQFLEKERGILAPQIQWLIAMPEFPSTREYSGKENEWRFTFDNGKTFTFPPDSENLTWLDPVTGPSKISANLDSSLIDQIEQSRAQVRGKVFKDGREFLDWLDGIKVQ
jgi:hypothetical protein